MSDINLDSLKADATTLLNDGEEVISILDDVAALPGVDDIPELSKLVAWVNDAKKWIGDAQTFIASA
jgi:hypothetical protein